MRKVLSITVTILIFTFSMFFMYSFASSDKYHVPRKLVSVDSTLAGSLTTIVRDPFTVKVGELWDNLDIPANTDYLRLSRGRSQWILKKTDRMNAVSYKILEKEQFFANNAEPGPADAFEGFYKISPMGINLEKIHEEMHDSSPRLIGNSLNMKSIINIPELRDNSDMFAGILPYTYDIRYLAKRIQPGDIITVSGMTFECTEETPEQNMMPENVRCAKVLFVTELDIKRF